jgi:myo-inositol-1-phosphate synthase
VVGAGGAVATTMAAGIELMRLGLAGREGLPLADLNGESGLAAYDDVVVGGWDTRPDDLATAAERHQVLPPQQLAPVMAALERITPWPALPVGRFVRNNDGRHLIEGSMREAVEQVRADLRRFRDEHDLDAVVVVNLASTEKPGLPDHPALATLEGLEAAIDAGDPVVNTAVLYAYAAIREGCPYANFTPSLADDAPAIVELAEQCGVPTAGKDGKTGQTMLKTVIAPALRARNLHVEGWYSTNILGNEDGRVLDDPASLASKLQTKGSVLDQCLGYHVENHKVRIDYYPPRGDEKEAWDAIDLVGFLGQRMTMRVNFLCKDSVLAAPLALELVRVLDLAARRGERGPQEQLGLFFKAPTVRGGEPEHALHRQVEHLAAWLAAGDRAGAET